MPEIEVNLPSGRAAVHIEPGALARVGAIASSVAPHARAFLAVDAGIAETHGAAVRASLESAGYQVALHAIDADEARKTLDTVEDLYAAMLAARLERESPVVAAGGGIVGDVAGFAAATWLRGVPLVHVPTTLLAMVDASIGGKTGVNFPLPGGGLGKNLVGAFWPPRAIVSDPLTLHTLDPRDFRCGLAECVKHGLLADATLLEFLESAAPRLLALEPGPLTELIERSARIKIAIVEQDEREAGRRALLNLGHTFAHAIEAQTALGVRHGEAVAIGLCAAARCAVATGRMKEREADGLAALLGRLGLPVRLPAPADVNALLAAMRFDKKVRGGAIRLVLPAGSGRAEIVGDVPESAVRAAWDAVAAA